MPAQVDWLNDREWRLALTDALDQWDSGLRENMDALARLAEGEAKARCPVRTGRLRRGVEARVDDDEDTTLLLYDEVEYSAFVEFGTRRNRAQPFLRPGLAAAQAAWAQQMVKGLK